MVGLYLPLHLPYRLSRQPINDRVQLGLIEKPLRQDRVAKSLDAIARLVKGFFFSRPVLTRGQESEVRGRFRLYSKDVDGLLMS